MEEVAAEEAAQRTNSIESKADGVTDKKMEEIDAAAVEAKQEAHAAVEKESSKALEDQDKKMKDLAETADKDADKLRDASAEKQREDLADVRDAAELDARQRAEEAVNKVKKGSLEDGAKVLAKADVIKEEARKLSQQAMDSSKVAMQAAQAARVAAESLPKDEAAKAIKYAKHAQDMSMGLQSQARYVKRVAKLAGVTAMHAVEAATEAQKYIKLSNEISQKAVAQAAKNAEFLKEIKAQVHKAADEAVDASGRSRTAVYLGTQANYTIAEMKIQIARKEAAEREEELEAMKSDTSAAQPAGLIAKQAFLSQHGYDIHHP
jgi:hypothetical protein